MSRPSEFFGSAARFYTRATAIACACNLLAISCLVYTLLLRSSPSFLSSPSSTRFHAADPRPRLDAQSESRMREALEARLALEPVELIKRVKEIREESNTAVRRQQRNDAARRKYAAELAQKLKQLRKASSTDNQQALEEWRKKKAHVKRKGAAAAAPRNND